MNNFEIHYTLTFPALKTSHYDPSCDSIGTTIAIKVGNAVLQKISPNQKKILRTLVTGNSDIKNASKISIRKNKDTFLNIENTDPLSWEIANYLVEEIKKP